MSLYPFGDFVDTLENGEKGLRIKGETKNNIISLANRSTDLTLAPSESVVILDVPTEITHGGIRGVFRRISGTASLSVLEVEVAFTNGQRQVLVERGKLKLENAGAMYGVFEEVKAPAKYIEKIVIRNTHDNLSVGLASFEIIDAPVSTPTIKSPNGESAIRVVEAAPAAYDSNKDVIKTKKESKVIHERVEGEAVNAGSYSDRLLFASVGSVAEILTLGFYAPKVAGATEGAHSINIYLYGTSTSTLLLSARAQYNADITIGNGMVRTPTQSQVPEDALAQMLSVKGVKFSDTVPLLFRYINSTDAQQNLTVVEIVKEEH